MTSTPAPPPKMQCSTAMNLVTDRVNLVCRKRAHALAVVVLLPVIYLLGMIRAGGGGEMVTGSGWFLPPSETAMRATSLKEEPMQMEHEREALLQQQQIKLAQQQELQQKQHSEEQLNATKAAEPESVESTLKDSSMSLLEQRDNEVDSSTREQDSQLKNTPAKENTGSEANSDATSVKLTEANGNNEQQLSTELAEGAKKFVLSRKEAYDNHTTKEGVAFANQWKLHGNGFLYTQKKLVLAAELPSNPQKGSNVVKIFNVHPDTSQSFQECHLLTLWVRLNGPEIFAGAPQPMHKDGANAPCHWEFAFELEQEGTYLVDAKILLWNGNAPVNFFESNPRKERSQCPGVSVAEDQRVIPLHENDKDGNFHAGFLGFKFYSALTGCCEICRRTEGCTSWATPPDDFLEEASFMRNGCELYYDPEIVQSQDIPRSHVIPALKAEQQRQLHQLRHRRSRRLANTLQATGKPESNHTDVAHFLGCGWSFHMTLDFPCLSGDLDDHIFMLQQTFDFVPPPKNLMVDQTPQLCQIEHEASLREHGRWIREEWHDGDDMCPQPFSFDANFTKMFSMTAFDGDHPHCWHRDDLSLPRAKCTEMNCRLIEAYSKWESSTLHQEKQWMGVWRNYDCDYMEFTNSQLQQCLDQRKISSISLSGASIATMLGEYVNLRTHNLKLFQPRNRTDSSLAVVIDSLKLPHLLWRETEDEWQQQLTAMPKVDPSKLEHYWVSSFFLASEREPYVHVARGEQLLHIAEEILTPKGYKMINAFDLTAAFAYDTAAQGDGLHIIGPPMKAIVSKLFHYMCSDYVEGSRI